MGSAFLLKAIATLGFQSMIRRQDWVGRWGGEEFLIIVPGPCDAEALGERVRRAIADSRYGNGGSAASFAITVSIGLASAGQSDQIDQILKKTDQALYRAKLTKNTVSMSIQKAHTQKIGG